MRLLEHFFLARIDRALDDGKPLTGLTRWFVMRSPRLRRYYESTLALELKLRFSDEIPATPPMIASRQATLVPRKSQSLIGIGTTVAACLLVAVGLAFILTPEKPTTIVSFPFDVPDTPESAPLELLAALVPLEGFDESLVDFSERPLELTSLFLAQVGTVITKHLPTELEPRTN